MSVAGAIVVYAVTWFMALLVALPIGLTTQGEAEEIVPGTPASAPHEAQFRKKLVWVTIATTVIWGAIIATVVWGGIGIRDIDFFGRM